MIQTFKQVEAQFLQNAIDNLRSRFCDDDRLIQAFNIFNPSNMVGLTGNDDIADYEKDKIQLLAETYGVSRETNQQETVKVDEDCTVESILTEWNSFKHRLFQHRHLSCAAFWKIFFQKYETQPYLAILETIYLLPPTTVDAERGFSKQNLVKTSMSH
jgi:hypothetical protein